MLQKTHGVSDKSGTQLRISFKTNRENVVNYQMKSVCLLNRVTREAFGSADRHPRLHPDREPAPGVIGYAQRLWFGPGSKLIPKRDQKGAAAER
jgi:hypothetical protein